MHPLLVFVAVIVIWYITIFQLLQILAFSPIIFWVAAIVGLIGLYNILGPHIANI